MAFRGRKMTDKCSKIQRQLRICISIIPKIDVYRKRSATMMNTGSVVSQIVPKSSFFSMFSTALRWIFVVSKIGEQEMTPRIESPGATRRRQGVEHAKTLVIFVNSIKTSGAIKYLAIDHSKKWCIRKRWRIISRFTSRFLICNTVKIHQSAVENRRKPSFWHVFRSASIDLYRNLCIPALNSTRLK